jgi:hypothetical protein
MNRLFLPILLLVMLAAGCVSLPPETMVLLNKPPTEKEKCVRRGDGPRIHLFPRVLPRDGEPPNLIRRRIEVRCEVERGEILTVQYWCPDVPGDRSAPLPLEVTPPNKFLLPEPHPASVARRSVGRLQVGPSGAHPTRSSAFDVRWVAVPANWRVQKRVRSWWLLASYPLWGLPRDLIDAPMTLAWRAGALGSNYDKVTTVDATVGIATVVCTTAGGPLLALHAISPLAVAIPVAVVAAPAGFVVTGVIVLNCWMLSNHVREGLIRPCQTALLRGGIRSLDYFPNWRFIVWDRRAVAREGGAS